MSPVFQSPFSTHLYRGVENGDQKTGIESPFSNPRFLLTYIGE